MNDRVSHLEHSLLLAQCQQERRPSSQNAALVRRLRSEIKLARQVENDPGLALCLWIRDNGPRGLMSRKAQIGMDEFIGRLNAIMQGA